MLVGWQVYIARAVGCPGHVIGAHGTEPRLGTREKCLARAIGCVEVGLPIIGQRAAVKACHCKWMSLRVLMLA